MFVEFRRRLISCVTCISSAHLVLTPSKGIIDDCSHHIHSVGFNRIPDWVGGTHISDPK